jgi:hypothetical protein
MESQIPELAESAVKRSEEQWRRNNEIEARTLQLDCDRRIEQAMAEVTYNYYNCYCTYTTSYTEISRPL